MAPLTRKSSAERKAEAGYCAWKGQLFIQDQQISDIALRSSCRFSIPAQLPTKLEIRHAADVSELRKKLPDEAFRIKNYSNHEVKCQDSLFCLYEVEILNQNEPKVVQLIDSLKEKKLALVKYLNDQGALILLASSTFVEEKDAGLDGHPHLQALFLISSPESRNTTASDWKCECKDNERLSQVALVLPALRHALLEGAQPPGKEGSPPGTLVQWRIREFAKQCKKSVAVSYTPESPPVSFDTFLKKSELEAVSEKYPPNSFAYLQHYLLHPQNYMLEMTVAVACMDATSESPNNAQDPDSSSGSNLDLTSPEAQLNPQSGDDATNTDLAGGSPLQPWKRKSSRLLGASARKIWSPLKALCLIGNSNKRKKPKKSPSPPAFKTLEPPVNSQKLTLQLKKLQNPLRGKRGAEVLSAEFVQETPPESPINTISSPGTEKKARLLRHKKDEEKPQSEERMETGRRVTRRSAQRRLEETTLEAQKEEGDENDPEKAAAGNVDPSGNKKGCDSHALNLLADLALSSCNSPLISNSSQSSLPDSPLHECHNPQRGEVLNDSLDEEYDRDTETLQGGSLSGRARQHFVSSPGEVGLSPELPSSSQEETYARKKGNAKSAKSCTSGETSDSSVQSLISSEHSYASPSYSKRRALGYPNSKNGEKYVKYGPLPGKVLPFRHQQNICHQQKRMMDSVHFSRSAIMAARLKEDFAKYHNVTFRDRTVKVTFQWEANYHFGLDSKYTNNSLEKTIVRAVHGPWDVSQSNDIEEMKLILHMWVALFYSKPFKYPTVRKVVEHNNPAKYISLNSVIDPMELIDDLEGACSLKRCPADSLSEANPRMPRQVQERAVSSTVKPLSCNELSSTNHVEDEFPAADPTEPHSRPSEIQSNARTSKDTVSPLDKVTDGEPGGESQLIRTIPLESPHGNLSREASNGGFEPRELGAGAEAELGNVVGSGEVSQSDSAPAVAKLPENSGAKQNSEPSAESQEISNATPAEEKNGSHPTGGIGLLHPAEEAWQEEDGPPRGVAVESQDLPMDEEEGGEESMDWESIDLALSDSNDADEESRNVDLDQEGDELLEENGVKEEEETGIMHCMASPADSLFTSVTSSVPELSQARQTELLTDSQTEKEPQDLKAGSQEFEDERGCAKDDNLGTPSPIQEVTPDDTMEQKTVDVSEDIKSILYELIDTVSAMNVESGETSPQEPSGSNWMSSVTLECVTPPDSDEESTIANRLAHTDQNWKITEGVEQRSTLAPQERATSQGQELNHSVLHGNIRCGQMFEGETLPESEPASPALGVLPSSSGTDWSVTRTTRLLCETPMVRTSTPKEDVLSVSMLCESEVRQLSHEASMSGGEDQTGLEILSCVPAEHQTEYSSKEGEEDTRGDLADSEDVQLGSAKPSLEESEHALHEVRTEYVGSPEGALFGEKAQLPSRASDMNKSVEDDSVAMDEDQEDVGSYHSNKAGGSCYTRSTSGPEMVVASDVLDLSPIRTQSDRMHQKNTERSSALEPDAMEHGRPHASKKADRALSTNNESVPPKQYVNFSVTKKHKEKTRFIHSSKRRESFMGDLGLMNSLSRTWRTWSDPIQDTLDMECLRFHDKVKQILRKPQPPTSADSLSPPVAAETLLRKVPGTPPLNPPPRSRSPLLITVVNPSVVYGPLYWLPRRSRHRDAFEPPPRTSAHDSLSKAARFKGQRQGSCAPFHLNQLNYRNKLKDSRGDISVIMDEFAEFSQVMTQDSRPTSSKGQEPQTTSEDAPEKRGTSLPPRTVSYEHLFDELCNTLHFRLKNVAQEACKKTYAFYLMETEDGPFFGRVKNLLKKGGHTEMDPLLFCKVNHMETERLMVIIRNEDIFQHIHKIPCLLRLKRFPNVMFVGIDRPEDLLDQTYQELFHSGGFVVSDDKVLETMTIGDLKEMVKTLEKLNGYGRWRWLLHYKEIKKLREDAREDPAALAKESLLKSYQGANITEALHYHQCDKAASRAEHLSCLLNLQVQHNSQRFAVFLTERSGASREALENKGILVLDVHTFVAAAEEMAAPFRSSSY
ncbi:protein TASOR 2 isoform X2 [Anolis sagrei]